MLKVKNRPSCLFLPIKFKNIYGYEMDFDSSIIDMEDMSIKSVLSIGASSMGKKRKTEYISGRVCAQKSLERLGVYDEFVGVNCDRSPCWPENVVGSITHSNSRAIAIVASNSNYRNLGVDVENTITEEVSDLISINVIDDEEHDVMGSPAISQLTKEEFVTLVFSAKESIFKALYCDVGYFFGFEVVKLIQASKNTLTFELRSSLCEKWVFGTCVEVYFRINDKVIFTMVAISTNTA
ncbi:4'-phosphopantetheinyl transferase family protein [Vibrio tritonius]|uniref:4'-phosphopantetheinyl transferase family protein n=1 Tax=Vibrio tritonius TaxID=1435069 RepID=UPI0008392612|nr:4'-phosphopantetheinyl transferase superfamily protein [Vibrio tritonius]